MVSSALGDAGASAWHACTAEETLAAFGTSADGLSEAEVEARLTRFGPNRFAEPQRVPTLRLLVDQVRSLVVALLAAAALIALVIGDYPEAIAIGAVLVLNTAIGFIVELRAWRSMEALLKLEVPRAKVIRNGGTEVIDASGLVPGDVVQLEAGDAVPADGRLIAAAELRANEAPLTGESLPVDKDASWKGSPEAALADRLNLVHAGTMVVTGSGRAVIVATGTATELGRIGRLVGGIKQTETPLERRLEALGQRLVWLTLGVAAAVTAVGLIQGLPLSRMLETGIALAVAAVPEGLPAVATIALAVGLARMARRRALIRRLHAVEALGSTTVVCTDKTGTLTSSQMTVTALRFVDSAVEATGVGYTPVGELRFEGGPTEPAADSQLYAALRIAALTARADVREEGGGWHVSGDPTDASLLVLARKGGMDRERLEAESPTVAELPFSSERMFTASFHTDPGSGLTGLVKGAPARLLDLSERVLTVEGERPLTEERRARLESANDAMAGDGLRVIGLARVAASAPDASALNGLTFVALAGLIDPPAEGVKETLAEFRAAGIRTVMLTGDQRRTAEAIARELGVLDDAGETMDGVELARLGEDEVARRIHRIGAFSRVTPEDKLTIVSALQRNGDVVAMLGDGVNDAAALRKAEVGVAMGRGTDVAKEVAGVILQDDRFPTIAAAIEEGRVIYDNIRKFVFYLFSCNAAEVMVLFLAGIAGLPLPLLPLQILWLNLVTDTFPALALALEPGDPDIMRRPPRDPRAPIVSRGLVRVIGFYAGLITLSTLAAFLWGLNAGSGHAHAITLSFMTLALAQLFHLGNARSTTPVVAPRRALSNRYAVGALILVVALQLLAVYAPPLTAVLGTAPLAIGDWLVVVPLALMPAVVGQVLRLARVRSTAE